MQYLLMIYEDETLWERMRDAERGAMLSRYFDYTKQLREAGVLLGGDALQPTACATTVRVRDGQVTTTDGPFAETREQLGGYYLIDVPDLDQALFWAARLPASETGSVEVRPIQVFTT